MPTLQPDVKQRKFPQQARARATADAILEASTQLLLRDGYDRFTTARVAERAGVSIGSLYQYFPNKAALAAAVIDAACTAFIAELDRALAGRPRITLGECIGAIVEVILESHHLAPDLHKVVIDIAPRIGIADKTDHISERMSKAIEGVLGLHVDEIAPGTDLTTAATMIETLLVALAHRSAHTGAGEGLAREATAMITRYLVAGE